MGKAQESKYREVLKWFVCKKAKANLPESLHWLAWQQRFAQVGQWPKTEAEMRVAVGRVLGEIWMSRRSQLYRSAQRAVGALSLWGQYIEAGMNDSLALSREDIIQNLQDKVWVSGALGLAQDDPFVRQVIQEAGRFKARGKVARAFSDAQSAGLGWWMIQIEREYIRQFMAGHRPQVKACTIDRSELMKAVRHQAHSCLGGGYPLVLQGPPGVGKSTLLELIANDASLQRKFTEGVRLVTLGPDMVLADLLQLAWEVLLPGTPTPGQDISLMKFCLRQVAEGKCLLFLLDDCYRAELAQAVVEIVSPKSLVIVTTRLSDVARALVPSDDYIVTVPGFSIEEARDYYRRAWNKQLAREVLDRLQDLWDLTRGNPLGISIALHHVKQHGWQITLQLLREPPPSTPEGVAGDLYSPLRLAYKLLSPDEQARFRQLGALLELRSYDLSVFVGLWDLELAHTMRILDRLASDAGLLQFVQEEEEGVWKIHQQVLKYAQALLAQSSKREQHFAKGWVGRALELPEQRRRHALLVQEATECSMLELIRRERITKPFIGSNFAWRGLRRLFDPGYVPYWQAFQAFFPTFTSEEYLLAARLRQREVKYNLLYWVMFALWVVFSLIVFFVPKLFGIDLEFVFVIIIAVLLGALTANALVLNRRYQILWLQLWERAIERTKGDGSLGS